MGLVTAIDIIVLARSNDNRENYDLQAPGSHGQISTNYFTEDFVRRCAIHGTDWLIFPYSSTTFPCPLSSQEIGVGMALRKEEADGRQLFYGNVIDLLTHPLYKGICCEMGAVRISPTLHHSFYCVGVMNFL